MLFHSLLLSGKVDGGGENEILIEHRVVEATSECRSVATVAAWEDTAMQPENGVKVSLLTWMRETDVTKGWRCPRGSDSDKMFILKNSVIFYNIETAEKCGIMTTGHDIWKNVRSRG